MPAQFATLQLRFGCFHEYPAVSNNNYFAVNVSYAQVPGVQDEFTLPLGSLMVLELQRAAPAVQIPQQLPAGFDRAFTPF